MFTPGRSYLLTGDLPTDLMQKLEVNLIDRIIIDANELEVKKLRAEITQALSRPLGERRLLLITNADSLSEVMQSTLLKILEEPPPYLIIILQAWLTGNLLATLKSRLQIIVGVKNMGFNEAAIGDHPDHQLRSVRTREELINLFRSELAYQSQQLVKAGARLVGTKIELLEKTIARLEQNCNQKLAIDSFLLHWSLARD